MLKNSYGQFHIAVCISLVLRDLPLIQKLFKRCKLLTMLTRLGLVALTTGGELVEIRA